MVGVWAWGDEANSIDSKKFPYSQLKSIEKYLNADFRVFVKPTQLRLNRHYIIYYGKKN
jgi:hypothetical protein